MPVHPGETIVVEYAVPCHLAHPHRRRKSYHVYCRSIVGPEGQLSTLLLALPHLPPTTYHLPPFFSTTFPLLTAKSLCFHRHSRFSPGCGRPILCFHRHSRVARSLFKLLRSSWQRVGSDISSIWKEGWGSHPQGPSAHGRTAWHHRLGYHIKRRLSRVLFEAGWQLAPQPRPAVADPLARLPPEIRYLCVVGPTLGSASWVRLQVSAIDHTTALAVGLGSALAGASPGPTFGCRGGKLLAGKVAGTFSPRRARPGRVLVPMEWGSPRQIQFVLKLYSDLN